jgi:hypothetical protein
MAEDKAAPAEGDEPLDAVVEGEQQAAEPEGGEDGGGNDDPVAQLARDMGWRPKEEFKGPEEQWKEPADFIKAGHEIQRSLGKELKQVRSTLDTVSRTSASLMEQQLAEQKARLTQQFNAAVEDGDAETARKASQAIDKLETTATTAKPTVHPESEAWAERHADWFNKDPLATELAIATTERLNKQGYSIADQLAAAERAVRKEYPELFPAPAKRQAAVHESGRDAGRRAKGKKGFAELPPEAQKVALDMEDRLIIPRETYAANFLVNQQPAQRRA